MDTLIFLKFQCLCIYGQLKDTHPQAQQSIEAAPQTSEEKMTDVSRIWSFLRHLTYLTERSGEVVLFYLKFHFIVVILFLIYA